MIPAEVIIGLVALFVSIGGQYFVLFKIYEQIGAIKTEFVACPYHRTGRKPSEVNDE